MEKILVIGGSGYIGSHTVVELINSGYVPIILDNFSNSNQNTINGIEKIVKKEIHFYEDDYRNVGVLDKIMLENKISGVIHFAALKAVGESIEDPLNYYSNNVSGFIGMIEKMRKHHINNLVFSSSAAVYGSAIGEVNEKTVCHPTSPYGETKFMDEIILKDVCNAFDFNGTALRYFNVVGAHPSGLIGELSKGKPANLLPIIIHAVNGKTPPLKVFGNDYNTKDGTCLRDYIHVVDLAKAHIAALKRISGFNVYNIGTGVPSSVLELIKTFEEVNKVKVPYSISNRRAGDPESSYANVYKASKDLGWMSAKTIQDSVADAWKWDKSLNK